MEREIELSGEETSEMEPIAMNSSEAVPRTEFITGEAGTGKTWFVRERAKRLQGHVLCATTGIAAVNLGEGVTTLNSLLGYFDTASLRDAWTQGWLETKLMKLYGSGVRQLVVDEVSMMDGEQLTMVVQALDSCNERLEAQGEDGLGLTLTGDFCLGLDTKIMLADGRVCNASAVTVGMEVMGPDSLPRKVLNTRRGQGILYRVNQTNGDSYVVNGLHKLVLKRSKDGHNKNEGWSRYPYLGDVVLMPAKTFHDEASRKFRECFVGFKAGLIDFPYRPIRLDPYFLGVWLGDGDSDAPRITNCDKEVVDFCAEYAKNWGLTLKTQTYEKTKAVRVSLTKEHKSNKANPLWEVLRGYNLENNKHIPEDFLLNSSNVRLSLLAGILDTDGCWAGKRYTITLSAKRLAEEVKQLADQLGFRTSINELKHGHYKDGGAWTVNIGGDTWRIPCKIERKKSFPRDLKRNRLTSVLTVGPVGLGEYIGFEITDDHLFLLGDGTVTHNCQLPPVKAKFAFQTEVWSRFAENTIKLTEIRRQADRDFIAALQAARVGNGKKAVEYFREASPFQATTDYDFEGVTLMAKNEEVDRFNYLRMAKLTGEKVNFESRREGKQRGEWKLIPEKLELKIGALVMILANRRELTSDEDDPKLLYANGDLGTLVEVEGGYAQVKLQRNGQVVAVEYICRKNKIPLEPGRKKELREQGKENLIDGKSEVVGSITYMPLRVAYASTVHKSQGLSLDAVQIDFRNSFFGAGGMLYVALSRGRTAKGIRLVGMEPTFVGRCKVNKEVKEWV